MRPPALSPAERHQAGTVLYEQARRAWLRTLHVTTDPYQRGLAEGRPIGVSLALTERGGMTPV